MKNSLSLTLTAAILAITGNVLSVAAQTVEVIVDGGFEQGSPNPAWGEYSENFGAVIVQGSAADAHSGSWFASFGSENPIAENAWLQQTVTFGDSSATISFWWTRPFEAANNEDIIELYVDGERIWSDQPYPGIGPLDSWIPESFDISQFADGNDHTIYFEVNTLGSTNTGNGSLWLIDDVSVMTSGTEPEELIADFSWDPAAPYAGEQIQFWNDSTGSPDQWEWDFGDGTTSTDKDPLHGFTAPGPYDVTLTVQRSADQTTDSITKRVNVGDEMISVDFDWDPPDPVVGQVISFIPAVQGSPDSFVWDFGDGHQSTVSNPTHTYEQPGEYVVILDVERTSDNATGSIQHTVIVNEPLFPEFTWDPKNPVEGEQVVLTDLSTGGPDAWSWDFGDGSSSDLQDPTHIWETPGQYPVTLTIWRGQDFSTQVTHTIVIGDQTMNAEFSWEPMDPVVGEEVLFSDLSTGMPDQWYWNFGDGFDSEEQNPSHVFEASGEYLVSLTISWSGMPNLDLTVEHWIVVDEPLFPEFSWDPEVPMFGEEVFLTDLSTGDPDAWSWDFGDGTTSTEQHPVHSWEMPGQYSVTLTISRGQDFSAEVSHTIIIAEESMTAFFSWDPANPLAGEEIFFSDLSTGQPDTWFWDFGDGTTSEEQHPLHVFEIPAEYPVNLTIGRTDDPDMTSTVELVVTVAARPLAAWFEWWPEEPTVGAEIEFLDLSEGDPEVWEWDFGDGTTSIEQFPVHTFSEPGTYSVTLLVTGSAGETDETTRLVTVDDDEYLADFSWYPEDPHSGQAVEFFDESLGNPVAWRWDFDDGRISMRQNPVHWFDEPGTYEVTLTVAFGPGGEELRSVMRAVEVAPPPLEADFFWIPLAPAAGETAEFTDVSRGRPESWFWDFGDGETSQQQHPAHAFAAPGRYTVSLTVERHDGNALISDTSERTIRVTPGLEIDFSWDPREPKALEPVDFIEDVPTDTAHRFWSFGDSETSSDENPTHVYHLPGTYRVQFWIADEDGTVLAAAEHAVVVEAPDLEIEVEVSDETPSIGQEVIFTLEGVEEVEGVLWAFGGIGCDGNPGEAVCIPTDQNDCLSIAYTYASHGLKPARAWVRLPGGLEVGPFPEAVQVRTEGECTSPPQADFTWWPAEPLAGQAVRCVDTSTGPPESWLWTFDDETTSETQHATRVFDTPGEHDVRLTIANDQGQSTVTQTITVAPVDEICGNGICEPGENSWTCPADCVDDPEGTGRNGRKGTNLVVPAAVGGINGAAGTYWLTEGSIVNPGDEDAEIVVEFIADNEPGVRRVAGPATIPPRAGVHFDNIVTELFGTHAGGSLWIDSNRPVIANTRTFNTIDGATFGQGIGGITRRDVLGEGDGSVFIIGLKQNERFRTNFLFQEVSGHDATVSVRILDEQGQRVGGSSIGIPARTKVQRRITQFWVDQLDAGYAVISVSGEGKIAAMASVVDQVTGDATSLDAVHTLQAEAGGSGKAGTEETTTHFLVAVVARTPGANDTVWRSEVSILNPEEEPQTVELRYVPADGEILTAAREVEPWSLFFSEDVVEEVFPEAADGAGSLHVFAQSGLVVNSRTYNVLPDDSTVGQAIPGLATGDMARPGEVWLLDSLKQTQDFRCNLGFAEYEGSDTEVTVVLFDTSGAALIYLASKKYQVPAFGQFQVNKVFQDMGLSGQFREAIAYISVASEAGAVYAYASIVDNSKGDATTVLGKRQ